jgi:hypothetical protein
VSLALVYFYWDLGMKLASAIDPRVLTVLVVASGLVFLLDAIFTTVKYISNKIAGIPNKTVGLE